MDEINPDSGVVDGRAIPEYENVWRMTEIVDGGVERAIGVWRDRVEHVVRDGQRLLVRTQSSEHRRDGSRHEHLDEMEAATLAPRRVRWVWDDVTRLDVAWQGRRFVGRHWMVVPGSDEGLPLELDVTLPRAAFDWHLWGVLIAGFPLADGYVARFVARAGNSTGSMQDLLRRFELHVVGRERVGDTDCFVVDVAAGVPWRFWISTTRRPRPVVQLSIAPSPGVVLWWKS
ncbi:MAG: hypothetical protein JWM53_1473 [bacterium]|nr:hypothetical protein [bacterium]